jgi:cysteine desulfurase
LDYQSTTPVDPLVFEAMRPYFCDYFGNPHSRSHFYGWEAEEAVEKARAQIASAMGADPKEIVFTSGATESNNLALKGLAHFYGDQKRHIVTLMTEHKCVLDSCRHLETEGFEVTYLPVQSDGLVDLNLLQASLRDDTLVVSVMAVHNEIGVIQPLKEIGAMCRARGIFFHTDAAQAFGKIPLDVDAMQIDLMSVTSHKIYGPKGIGALYVRRSKPRVRLNALIHGGGQERGMRAGTLPTPLVVGFGAAVALAMAQREEETARIRHLGNVFYDGIRSAHEHVTLNGSWEHRWPGNLNLSFGYIEGESMMMAINDLAVSSGSACTSASLEPSYVLRALGVDEILAHSSIRFGIGRFTTEAEILYAIGRINAAVSKLRAMSPLWEMVQEGIDLNSIQWEAH